MDAAQAGPEAVVAHHHHGGPALVGQLAEHADRVVQTADHLGGGVVPFGPVDACLVDIEIGPDAVLERVEVLELDHQHRPVGDELSASTPPRARPRKLSAVSPAFWSALRAIEAPVSRSNRARSRAPRSPRRAANSGAAESAASRWGASIPETTIPRTLSGGYKPGTLSETIGPARAGEQLPDRRHADPARMVDLHPSFGGVIVAVVEDAVPRRPAAGHHGRPGRRGDRRDDRPQCSRGRAAR